MGIPMWWKRSGLSSLVLMADWRLLILPVIVLFEARRDASLTCVGVPAPGLPIWALVQHN